MGGKLELNIKAPGIIPEAFKLALWQALQRNSFGILRSR
jgi:hypothetical protein